MVDNLAFILQCRKWSSSPYINRFLSADTIVPSYANPQSLNRYSYVVNNPLRYTDPTGHMCHPEDDCGGPHSTASTRLYDWKWRIKHKFGVTLSDDGAEHPYFVDKDGKPTSHGLAWDLKNVIQVYEGLSNMNDALGGNLKSIIGSAIYTLNSHPVSGHYFGHTSGQTVDFYVTTVMPLQNLYHESGHVLNNLPGADNHFSDALANYDERSFILAGGNNVGQLDPSAFISTNVSDANYGSPDPPAMQHASTDSREQWADIFANFVAGNINLSSIQGTDMNNFITGVLP